MVFLEIPNVPLGMVFAETVTNTERTMGIPLNNLISPENEDGQQQSQKRFWSYIKSLKNDHNNITALSTINGILPDNIQKANTLNSQLKSAFT